MCVWWWLGWGGRLLPGGGARNRDEFLDSGLGSKVLGNVEKTPFLFGVGAWLVLWDVLERNRRWAPPADHSPLLASHPVPFLLPGSCFSFSFLLFPLPISSGKKSRDLPLSRACPVSSSGWPEGGNREGQQQRGSCFCLFVHSLAGTAPLLEKQAPRFMYLIIIKNLF